MPVKKAFNPVMSRIISLKMDKSKMELCFGKILQIDLEIFDHCVLNMFNPNYSVGHCDALFN